MNPEHAKALEFYKLFANWSLISEDAPEEYKKGCVVLPASLHKDVQQLIEKFSKEDKKEANEP